MSLQVWLPLNGDLRQQGLSNLSFNNISSTNTTINNSGKIGKCYNNDSHTAGGLISDGTLELGQQQSMFCWFKFTDLSSNSSLGGGLVSQHRHGSNTGMGITIRYVSATTGYLSVNTGNGSSRTFNTYYGTTLLQANTWYHGGYTYDGSTIKIYVNGVCEKTQAYNGMSTPADYITCFCWSMNSTSGNTTLGSYKFQGSLNDVRVYDHCLSESEVKRLAQGLIVHYPLNRQGLGQENLWRNGSCQENLDGMIQSTVKFNITTKDGFKCAHISGTKGSNATGYLAIPDAMLPEANAWYTISADMRIDNYSAGTTNPYVGLYFGGDYLNTDNTGGWYGGSSYSGDGKADAQTFVNTYNNKGWHRVSCTVQYLHGGTEYKKGAFRLGYVYARDFTGDLYVKNIKFEKGKIATPWCPNIIDIDNIGLDSTTEYDISGFGYNGTRINFPQQNLLLGTDFSIQYTTGLVTNSSTDWTKYLRGYNTNTLHTFNSGEDTITLNTASNLGVCFVRKATGINLDSNSYYTLSCEAKSTQTAKPLCIGLSYYNSSNTWVWRGGTNPTNFTTANTWQKFSLTFKPDADTQYICYCFTVVGVANSTDTFTIRHCKLEKGSVATPWVEDSYSSWTSDTPKYNVSTKFSGSNYIKTLPGEFSWSNYDNLTIAVWMKPAATPSSWTGSVGIASDASSYTSKAVAISNYGGKFSIHIPNGSAWGVTQSTYTIPLNTWHHCVATISGTTVKMYVDGVLNKTFTADFGTATNHASPQIQVGIDLPGGDEIYNGYYSDVRIYATALSAADVKSLYQNCATIGPDGTIYGQIRS